jgi:hypothetical protein
MYSRDPEPFAKAVSNISEKGHSQNDTRENLWGRSVSLRASRPRKVTRDLAPSTLLNRTDSTGSLAVRYKSDLVYVNAAHNTSRLSNDGIFSAPHKPEQANWRISEIAETKEGTKVSFFDFPEHRKKQSAYYLHFKT